MKRKPLMYYGVPLTTYCKDNNLNINTVYSFIRRAKANPKYDSLSENEIISIAISNSQDNSLYDYKGIPLKVYCEEQDYPYNIAIAKLKYLKDKYPTLNNREIVSLLVEYYILPSLALSFEGLSLYEFCKKNNYSYSSLKGFIYSAAERNPLLSVEDIVKLYIEQEHKGVFKYYYKGVTLKEYCNTNNISYTAIIALIGRKKEQGELEGLTDDQIVEKVMGVYKPIEKRMYKGQSLYSYCMENDINYSYVCNAYKKKKSENPELSDDQILFSIIDNIKINCIKYYYNGIPLIDYCQEKDLNVKSIRVSILRKSKLNPQRPIQEIVDECVNEYNPGTTKYYYNGIPIVDICSRLNINYDKVLNRFKKEYKGKKDISQDEVFKEIFKSLIINPTKRTKYTIDNESLYTYCEKKKLPYNTIINIIRSLKEEDESIKDDDAVKEAIRLYRKRLYEDKANGIFNYLTINKIEDINEAKKLCDTLKIDFENVIDSNQEGLTYSQAILLIWYFADCIGHKGRPMVTGRTLTTILGVVSYLKRKMPLDKVNFFLLVRVHKCCLYNATKEILSKESNYINDKIKEYSKKYGIKLDQEKLTELIKGYIMKAIDSSFFNKENRLLSYIDETVNNSLDMYIYKYILKSNTKTLEFEPKKEA